MKATSDTDFHVDRGLLRFITCGSVDDGKSTLIGRLLYDSGLILDDTLSAMKSASASNGRGPDYIDYSLLVDGLEAEREQGITIDVAYRYFQTAKRSFIVADTPGHEQYTRNMVTGASNADAAIILIDASKGLLTQSRRHAFICSLVGIKHLILAINKMDLVRFDQSVFDGIVGEFQKFASRLNFNNVASIPVCALEGDNITSVSCRMPWYCGPALRDALEEISVVPPSGGDFRLPVQWVNRTSDGLRGYAGTIASGSIEVGQPIHLARGGPSTSVQQIITFDASLTRATAGQSVTLTLDDEVDIARGDLLYASLSKPEFSEQFEALVIWMDSEALMPGRSYLIKLGTLTVSASITQVRHKINVTNGDHLAADVLELNEVGLCNISCLKQVGFDPYEKCQRTGSFIVIDRITNRTVGAGMVQSALRRDANIAWQKLSISRGDRADLKHQKPLIIWLTGLSGAGKSTVANAVERALHAAGRHTMLIDGDNLRHGLSRDLDFNEADRVENIRRAGEVAKILLEAGLIAICSFISPYRAERDALRRSVQVGHFIEVFVDTPLSICMQRDPKGLYKKVQAGALSSFSGVDAPYEQPLSPEIRLDTLQHSPEELALQITNYIDIN